MSSFVKEVGWIEDGVNRKNKKKTENWIEVQVDAKGDAGVRMMK